MRIRDEQPQDHDVIRRVTELAFAPKAFSDGTEGVLVGKLRTSGELTLSLVAESEGAVVGHVAFSPVSIGPTTNGWFGLGPVSVHPDWQQQGIGSTLIREGLHRLIQKKASGCALIGDPGYYHRFGFHSDGNVRYKDVSPEIVQWLSFDNSSPTGELVFAASFDS